MVTEEMIAGWKEEFGAVHKLGTDAEDSGETAVTIYCRVPRQQDLNRFAEMSMKGKTLKGMQGLVEAARLYPDADTVSGWFSERPALALSLGNAVFKLAGGGADFTAERL